MGRLPRPQRDFRLDFTEMRRLRRFRELSQVDLASAAGVNPSTIWRTERNVTSPSLEQLVACARALGAPMHTLFRVVEQPADQ